MEKKLPKASIEDAQLLNNLIKQEKNACEACEIDYKTIEKISEQIYVLYHKLDWYNQEFEKDGLKGMKDCTGELLIPAAYDEIPILWHYNDRKVLTPVKKDGLFGFAVPDGKEHLVLPCQYEKIKCCELLKVFIVSKPGCHLLGLVDSRGKEFLPCEMEEINECGDGSFAFKKEGKWGHAIPHADLVLPAIFDMVEYQGPEEFYVYTMDGKRGRSNAAGKFFSEEEIAEMSDEQYDNAEFLFS